MTDRDRLIELLDGADLFLRNRATPTDAPLNEYDMEIMRNIAKTCDEAARVLEKAIIPPCKVGDTVYYPYEYRNVVLEKTVIKIVIEKEDRWLDVGVSFLPFENIGKTVFLTKEEAEEKLKELKENGY